MSRSEVILVVDDEAGVLSALRLFMKGEGWAVQTASSPAEALAALARQPFSLLLTDLNFHLDTTSGREGIDLIRQVRALDADLPIVAMTGWGSIDIAVEAMRSGANDFIEKPWNNARLAITLRNLLALAASRRAAQQLVQENAALKADQLSAEWVADSAPMQQVMQTVAAIAAADVNVLITGENGTGKSQLAELIHRQSARAGNAFVSLNMGAIPETLFESELFGHMKGAFTDAREHRTGRFELADGGTLFMDEIGNIPHNQQAKLLHVLENGRFERLGSSRSLQVDVRIISATNADLDTLIGEGRFRRDLLYRLNSVQIELPPLRERGEDVLQLADQYLRRYARKYRKPDLSLSASAQRALLHYDWPGNVRELAHVLERAVLLSREPEIDAAVLGVANSAASARAGLQADTQVLAPLADDADLNLERAEKQLILAALDRHKGNAIAAAQALGLSRSAFYRRLEKFGL